MDQLFRLLRRYGCGLILAVLLVGCGGPAQPGASQNIRPAAAPVQSAAQTTNGLPACARADTTIPMPPEFPASFPLPPGTIVTAKEDRIGRRLIIKTVVPALDVRGLALFLERELPKAGFTSMYGESEPGEAESSYEGNGYKGRWVANSIQDCPEAITLIILVGR